MKIYGKKTLIIARIILFAVGAFAGYVAMRALFVARPDLALGALRYVYCASTGLLAGLILMLSAKSVLWLVFTVGGGIKNLFSGKRAYDVAGVFIGLAVGGILTYLFDFLISLSLNILSLRIIADVAFAALSVGLAVFISVKSLRCPLEDELTCDGGETADFNGGYLLTSSALAVCGIENFCRDWLIGGAVVTDATVSALIDKGKEDALGAYKTLLDCGFVHTVSVKERDEKLAALNYAAENGLRIITADKSEFGDCPSPVLSFAAIAKYNGQSV